MSDNMHVYTYEQISVDIRHSYPICLFSEYADAV